MCAVTGIVASIGLIEDRVEIVIGSMLVSPLLIPLTQDPHDDGSMESFALFRHNAALFGMGILCIGVFSFLSTLIYEVLLGLNPYIISSELEARAMGGTSILRLIVVNVAISVPSGFLYTIVRRKGREIESIRHSSHIIGIAISTALAPPAGAIGVLTLAYFRNRKYFELYDIFLSFSILAINVSGILSGVFIAYVLVDGIADLKETIAELKKIIADLKKTIADLKVRLIG